MADDLFKSLKAYLYERSSSPFLASFLFFWLYFNWKAILYLTNSDKDIETKLEILSVSYADSWNNYWYPLIYTLVFSVIYPFFSLFPYSIHNFAQILKVKIKRRFEEIKTISVDKYRNMLRDIKEKESEYSEHIDWYKQNEKDMKEEIIQLSKEIVDAKNDLKTIKGGFVIDIGEENEESARRIIDRVVSGLENQLNNTYSDSLSRFNRDFNEINKNANKRINFQIYSEWIDNVKARYKERCYLRIVDEITGILRNIYNEADELRTEVKNLKTSQLEDNEKSKYLGMREEWDTISSQINRIIDNWRRFCDDYLDSDETTVHIGHLNSINKEESEPQNPSIETVEGNTLSERQIQRRKYWTQLLEKSKVRTELHKHISPTIYSWIGTSMGLPKGIYLNYVIRKHDSRVELYIDQDKESKEGNTEIFNHLKDYKSEIESNFGDSLEWEYLEDKRACRIKKEINAGGWADDNSWDNSHDIMITNMIRLHDSLMPYLSDLKSKYN